MTNTAIERPIANEDEVQRTLIVIGNPGQGEQTVGMLDSLVDNDTARRIFLEASDVVGADIMEISRREDLLGQTRWSQIVTVAANLAVNQVIKDMGIETDMEYGHSLGEISIFHNWGAIGSIEDALTITEHRARITSLTEEEQGQHGGMAAILGSEIAVLKSILRNFSRTHAIPRIRISNYNGPSQGVLSLADNETLERVLERLDSLKRLSGLRLKTIRLNVERAFHSEAMLDEALQMAEAIADVKFLCPDTSVELYSTTTGERVKDPEEVARIIPSQLIRPVRHLQVVRQIADRAIELRAEQVIFIEAGPNKRITGDGIIEPDKTAEKGTLAPLFKDIWKERMKTHPVPKLILRRVSTAREAENMDISQLVMAA